MSGDIVERLRYEAWRNPAEGETADAHYLAADALAEIERLRRLGDTLAHHVRAGESKEMYSAVHAWEEARRER